MNRIELPIKLHIYEALESFVHSKRCGTWPRVLCVCSAALTRSPTLAWVLSNPPYNCNAVSAGTRRDGALIPITQALMCWAERVVFVNPLNHRKAIDMDLKMPSDIYILDIEDHFVFREPELVQQIAEQLKLAGFPKEKP